MAYGSALESAACLDVLTAKECCLEVDAVDAKRALFEVVAMLIGLRKSSPTSQVSGEVREESSPYGSDLFDHEQLPVYQDAMELVRWADRVLGNDTAFDTVTTSIVLNIAEGNGKFSTKDRCRYLDTAHTSTLRCAATLDVAAAAGILKQDQIVQGKRRLASIAPQLAGWIRSYTQEQEAD